MGATTPTYLLPYPAASDPADVPADVKRLADRLEVVLAQLQAATPAQPLAGDLKWVGYPVAAGSEDTQCPGWLLCDGRAVSRATYAALFAKVGTAHGAGDGSTTFNLPDSRGRSPMGAGTGAGLSARALGAKLGEETHAISVGELPSHDHGGVTSAGKTAASQTGTGVTAGGSSGGAAPGGSTSTIGDHTHPFPTGERWLSDATGNDSGNRYGTGGIIVRSRNDLGLAGAHAHSIAVDNHAHTIPGLAVPALAIPQLDVPQLTITAQGGGGGHNTVHPCFVANCLIKT